MKTSTNAPKMVIIGVLLLLIAMGLWAVGLLHVGGAVVYSHSSGNTASARYAGQATTEEGIASMA